MRLTIEHRTSYRYEPPVKGLALRLRLFATATAQQAIARWRVTVDGEEVTPLVTPVTGEPEALWFQKVARGELDVVAEGEVETFDNAGIIGRDRRMRPGVYLRSTDLTEPDDAIRAMADEIEGEGPLARLHALNERLNTTLDYRGGVTDSSTTAAQVAALEAGVCQDYAHLFVAVAREMGVPARYVAGYLHDGDAPVMETHAWAECWLPELGWTGFDPVHNLCPTEAYVRLCSGLDAADAAPIRGTFPPGPEEEMEVSVAVARGQSQSQSQNGQSQSQSQ